jgi:hypothetical protein
MVEDIIIEPMTVEFILWRCLHFGPLSCQSIDKWPTDSPIDLERCRTRNIPLLKKLTRLYGACAILARAGDQVVGQLRFYPREVWNMAGAGELCLQQDHPNGPAEDFADTDFPPPARFENKTLAIHCLMTGSPQRRENPYQRKGVATGMVKFLITWAKARGWKRIEVDAFEDLDVIYEITGSAGYPFWEKLGFRIVDRHPHPYLQDPSDFLETLEKQAVSVGIPVERARDRIIMRLDLE